MCPHENHENARYLDYYIGFHPAPTAERRW
jgi:hypothetical protein